VLEVEELPKKSKAKGPPPAAVPITKKYASGPPKPVIKKSNGASGVAIMQ
jgi:hypothetical protein